MSKTVFIAGNDGSGKSTYARRLSGRLRRSGMRVGHVGYYDSSIRRAFRGVVERMTGASGRKRAISVAPQTAASSARSSRRPAMRIFLWCYQFAMAMEWRLRDAVARADVLVCERSFLDDLASIAEVLRVEPSDRLIGRSGRWFPVRRLCYLTAGHEVEYGRIVAMDLSPQLHQRKGQRYEQWVRVLEASGLTVRRINTRGRVATSPTPAEGPP